MNTGTNGHVAGRLFPTSAMTVSVRPRRAPNTDAIASVWPAQPPPCCDVCERRSLSRRPFRYLFVCYDVCLPVLGGALTGVLVFCAGVLYQGPRFVSEPPGLVRFTNSSGAQLDCRGSGTPPVDVRWTLVSGEPVSYVPGVR